ncbi:hypothetical protein JCM6882_002941 [Rhodosporidiobolus microsporus]
MEDTTAAPSFTAAHPSTSGDPTPSLTVTLRCTSVPSSDSSSSTPATHISSVPVPRPSSLSAALSSVRSSFPHLASAEPDAFYLERIFVGADAVKVTDELWAVFAFLPSEAGAVYRVVDEKKPKKEEEDDDKDVKPKKEDLEDEEDGADQRARKRRRERDGGRTESAPSPEVEEKPVISQPEALPPNVELEVAPKGEYEATVVLPFLGPRCKFRYDSKTTFGQLRRAIQAATSLDALDKKYSFRPAPRVTDPESSSDEDDGQPGDLRRTLFGCAPVNVFYLLRKDRSSGSLHFLRPSRRSLKLKVSLRPHDNYSAEYFPTPDDGSSDHKGTVISWSFSVSPGGILATSNGSTFPSLSIEPTQSTPHHLASLPITPGNSFSCPATSFLPILTDVVSQLRLPLHVRGNFLDKAAYLYRSSVLRSSDNRIAFRFLHQDELDAFLPLTITPKPDIVARLLLICDYLYEGNEDEWRDPSKVEWEEETGVDGKRIGDDSLFRVIGADVVDASELVERAKAKLWRAARIHMPARKSYGPVHPISHIWGPRNDAD